MNIFDEHAKKDGTRYKLANCHKIIWWQTEDGCWMEKGLSEEVKKLSPNKI